MELFPWNSGEKPYFVNEEGFEWYIDKSTTDWCKRYMPNGCEPLAAACFFVKKEDQITRVLINDKQQIIAEDTSLEGMAVKIDQLRILKSFSDI